MTKTNEQQPVQVAFTSSQAAHYIGMTEGWLRQQRHYNSPYQPPYIRIGRTIRYLRADLDAWLESHRNVTADES